MLDLFKMPRVRTRTSALDKIFDGMGDLFSTESVLSVQSMPFSAGWSEHDGVATLEISVAGYPKSSITVRTNGDIVEVSGNTPTRRFTHQVSLPDAALEDSLVAKVEDGLLTLTVETLVLNEEDDEMREIPVS